jgi:ferredoxin
MTATIFYFTGTGNSLWVARTLAQAIGDVRLTPIMGSRKEAEFVESDCVGIVFPVYMWGVPAPVVRFVNNFVPRPKYTFAVAVNGGQVANALVELENRLKRKEIKLAAGFEITTPSNYIPWGGPGPKEKQEQFFKAGAEKMERIVATVRNREDGPIERGALWQRIFLTAFHKIVFPLVPRLDRKFVTDEKCNSCGLCKKICPVGNIELKEGRPVWNHRCEQCLACIQWCPREAIQYGKKTAHYERYHHPEITLKDMLVKNE